MIKRVVLSAVLMTLAFGALAQSMPPGPPPEPSRPANSDVDSPEQPGPPPEAYGVDEATESKPPGPPPEPYRTARDSAADARMSLAAAFFFGLFSVASLFFALFQYGRAKQQHAEARAQYKKAEEANRRLREVEKAITSFEYLKKRGLDLYENGMYDKSLDTLKRYYHGNDDKRDLYSTIHHIFWKESRKLYPSLIPKDASLPGLVMAQITASRDSDQAVGRYALVLTGLLDLYQRKFKSALPSIQTPILLADGAYEDVREILEGSNAFGDDAVAAAFREMVLQACAARVKAKALRSSAEDDPAA